MALSGTAERSGTLVVVELILLHGFDAGPENLTEVADSVRAALPGWSIRLLDGPVDIVDGRKAWWQDGDCALPDVRHALEWLTATIGEEPLVVAGFSQGGAFALAAGFGLDGCPSGVNVLGAACIGGFVPDEVHVGPTSLELFIAHGTEDDVVDPFHAQSLARLSARHGIGHELMLHGGGHEWPSDVTERLISWLVGHDWTYAPEKPGV